MDRWECNRHPGRFVRPHRQKRGCHTGCSRCAKEQHLKRGTLKRRIDGTKRPHVVKHDIRRGNVSAYKRSVILRKLFLGRLRGLKLIERSCGINLEDFGFTRQEINAQYN
jgi:hypothetical protein